MRRLAVLALVLFGLVAVLVFTTGDARRTDDAVAPAASAAVGAEEEAVLAEIRCREGGDARVETTTMAESGSERRPARKPRTEIAGVVRHDDGEPAAHAIVGLFAPAPALDGDQSQFGPQELRDRPDAETMRLVESWTRTDTAGRFRFEYPKPGQWIVRADLGPLLATATPLFAIDAGVSRSDLVLNFPPAAWVEGRLIAPPGATFEGVRVELRANDATSLGRWCSRPDRPENSTSCTTSAEGTFRIGPAHPGLHTLWLGLDPRARERATSGSIQTLVTLELNLPAGVTHRDIDLRDGFPGAVALSIGMRHDFAADLEKNVVSHRQLRVWGEQLSYQAVGDAVNGAYRGMDVFELGPLPPGDWRVHVQVPQFGPWSWTAIESLRVLPAQRIERRFELAMFTADIALLDADTGAPLQTGFIEVGRMGQDGLTSVKRRLHAPGHVALTLPPGDYMLTARKEGLEAVAVDARAWVSLAWSASGPATTVLRVPR